MNPRMNFVRFSPFYTESPPLAIEKIPPIKSKMMLFIDHPTVLFLLQFQQAAGVHLIKVKTSFPYPKTATGFQYSYSLTTPVYFDPQLPKSRLSQQKRGSIRYRLQSLMKRTIYFFLSLFAHTYFVDYALEGFDQDHGHTVVYKDQVGNHNCACTLYFRKISDTGVDCVKGVACKAEYQIIQGVAFNAKLSSSYDLSLQFSQIWPQKDKHQAAMQIIEAMKGQISSAYSPIIIGNNQYKIIRWTHLYKEQQRKSERTFSIKLKQEWFFIFSYLSFLPSIQWSCLSFYKVSALSKLPRLQFCVQDRPNRLSFSR